MVNRAAVGLALIFALGLSEARADYPQRPITLMVPFAAGGGSDRLARLVTPYLEKHLPGARIAVVNRPGAGGNVAYEELAAADTDGYTIGLVNFPDVIVGPMTLDVTYTLDDFRFLGSLDQSPTTISVLETSPHASLGEFLKAAEDRPGELSVAVPSVGNVHHLGLVLLSDETGLEFNVVPFGGGGPARTAVLGDHVDAGALSISAVVGHGLRILGQMSDERVATGKGEEIPTFQEAVGIDVTNYVMRNLAVPKDVSDDIVAKLQTALEAALADPDLRAEAEKQDIELTYTPGEDLARISERLGTRFGAIWDKQPWLEN